MQHDEAIKIFERYPGLPTDVRRALNRILDDHNIERTGRIELIAERDQIRAELAAAKNRALIAEKQDERSRHLVCLWKDDREAQSKALSAMTAERNALAADNERLRNALEVGECYMKVFRHELARNNATFEGSEDQAEVDGDLAKVQSALAATPAQSLAAHDAALLRKIATKFRGDLAKYWDGTYGAAALHLEAEADRIEQEASK